MSVISIVVFPYSAGGDKHGAVVAQMSVLVGLVLVWLPFPILRSFTLCFVSPVAKLFLESSKGVYMEKHELSAPLVKTLLTSS